MLIRDSSPTAPASVTRKKIIVVPGREYVAQAYVFTTSGTQTLTLDFYDAYGTRIQRHHERTPGAHRTWSRMTTRGTAPANAASATIVMSSASTSRSEAWWDGVQAIGPMVTNSGFETQPTSTSPVPGWSFYTGPGTSIETTTAYARLGRRSVSIDDRSTTGGAWLRSRAVPAFPGVGHDVRFWVRPGRGTFKLAVKWYTASGVLISATTEPVSYPSGGWRLVNRTMISPPTAAKAVMELSSSNAAVASAAFDVVSIRPSVGAPARTSTTVSMGEPLEFSNTAAVEATVIGGRPKLYTVVSGYPAAFEVLDVQTNTVETTIPFSDPNISQTGTMVTGADGRVYVGTQGGRLWRWTPGSTSLEDLGRVTPSATMVWDLEVAPDGRIWGGTYPDGVLFAFDPTTDAVVARTVVSANHSSVRSVAVDAENVYVGVSPTSPTFFRVPLSDLSKRHEIPPPVQLTSGNLSELEVSGSFLALLVPGGTTVTGQTVSSSRYLYDLRTGSFDVAANVPGQLPSQPDAAGNFYYILSSLLYRVDSTTGERTQAAYTKMPAGRDRRVVQGSLDGEDGEWLLAYDPNAGLTAINLASYREIAYPVDFAPTASRMKSMAPGPDGKLYVGGYGGASLSVVDPSTGEATQYPEDPTAKGAIGEVEGMIANGQYMFLGTYTGGKIFRYDTTQPWVDGSNPAPIAELAGIGQDRPQAWAVLGARTFFGTVPRYGELGGDLGIIDSLTATPRIVNEPVADQSVVSLAAYRGIVFGGTSRWGGLGIDPTTPTARVFAYDLASGRKLWEVAPAADVQSYGAVLVTPRGELWAAAGPVLYQLNRGTGAVIRRIELSSLAQPSEVTWRNVDMEYVDGLIHLSAGPEIYAFDPATLRVTKPAGTTTTHRLLGEIGSATFYPDGTRLMRITRQ
ncbi:PQQ-binding-like beta-propeller repeat protein [Cellulomonas carbonis]|uniref:PQQ-binding-like beta-propeller repeat protein n=1 Tax=Cellulomonas carbonis T26 TaxID=947969 RepID=A0A0A0BU56_9CELL|nr:PQQ-binding-like beta-propeller repeat protein [Cellulomonas carbonis]KGM11461.1 hypothetical protein N868_08920 [Cellulomonas carbonis T26]